MVNIEIKLTRRGERTLRAMERPDRWWGRVMPQVTLLIARRIERYAKRFAPVRTGGGRRSIGTVEVRSGHNIVSDLHMLVMEEGRKPGTMPPVEPLERWARRKLGVRGLGFVIARSIARKGIAPRRFFARAIEQVTEREKGKQERDIGRIVRRELKKESSRG